ncbi:MAG: putative quinol monooxygenase [Pseudomonadota bacterium]
MIILLGTAKLGEGSLEEGRAALETMIAASNAEEGVLDYSFSVDLVDPSVLHITEKYVDQAALGAHGQSQHMAAFQKAMAGLDIKIVDLMMFNADDGTKLM